jgi:Glycosyltransferase 61
MNPAALKRLVPGPLRNALREFRWPPSVVRWLPGDSRQFGPPRRWQPMREYFTTHPGELREVLPAHPLVVAKPTVIGEFPPRFLESSQAVAPAGQVFTVRDASLLGPEGWVVAPPDTFLPDAGFEVHDPRKRLADFYIFRARQGRAKTRRRLPGRCLSLASDYSIGGFGHFIHDSLSRLLLIDRAGLRPDEFDWVFLPRPDTLVVRQLVAQLGLKPERLLSHDPAHDLDCAELTGTRFPGIPGYFSPPFADYLRGRFAPRPQRRDRRIYLSRRGYRRNFANAPIVEELLRRHGFEEVCPHEDSATLQKCAEAEFVFSLEGANFFNALFCPAGTRVLLVFPDRLPHNLPFALSLAGACGFPTFVMNCATIGPAGIDGGIADVNLDPASLEHALQVLGAA